MLINVAIKLATDLHELTHLHTVTEEQLWCGHR